MAFHEKASFVNRVEKHMKNTYLKRVDALMVVEPAPNCWMELCE